MAHIKWGSSPSGKVRCVFDCAMCNRKWVATSEVSTCQGCNVQYLPVTDTRFSSRIATGKKRRMEQLELNPVNH